MSQQKIIKLFELKSQGLTDGAAARKLKCDRRTVLRLKKEPEYMELVADVKADLILNISSLQNRIITTVNKFIDELDKKKMDMEVVKLKTNALKTLSMFCNLSGEI